MDQNGETISKKTSFPKLKKIGTIIKKKLRMTQNLTRNSIIVKKNK